MDRRSFLATASKCLASTAILCPAGQVFGLTKRSSSGRTGYAHDQNDIMFSHPHSTEQPARIKWIQQSLDSGQLSPLLSTIIPVSDPFPSISLVHTAQHIASIKSIPLTGPAAEFAVANVLGAVRDVCRGTITNAFCSIRPPGHHSHNAGGEEGFCFYCNAAIAAKYAQTSEGINRVLIIDWDYHHGNGTQYAFYTDPSVLFFSTHNCDSYPGRFIDTFIWEGTSHSIGSDPTCKGLGTGLGFNINVHMACGSTNDDFVKAWSDNLVSAADAFKPELVIISAGFDSKKSDMLGCFDITATGFSRLTKMAMDIAQKHCSGRCVSILEGGYADSTDYAAFNGLACCAESHVRTLVTGETQTEEPLFYRTGVVRHAPHFDRRHIMVRGDMLRFPLPPAQPEAISIIDARGKTAFVVPRSCLASGGFALRDAHLPPGLYAARIATAESGVIVLKFRLPVNVYYKE